MKRFALISVVLVAAVFLLQRSDIESGDLTQRIHGFTRGVEFDYGKWGLEALSLKVAQVGLGAVDYLPEATQKQLVLDYLNLVLEIYWAEAALNEIYADPEISDPEKESSEARQELAALYSQRDQLAPLAEAILQNQITTVAADFGLTLGGQSLPPVLYHVTPLPLALIVSPRDTIRQDANISLIPDLTVADRANLEAQVDKNLDVSSLAVNIGGVGMYPTMVMQTTNINWLAEVVAHEWIHNVLTLRPLGASYMSSPELRTMNETAANIAGKEIGAALIERFYPEFVPPPPPVDQSDDNSEPLHPPEPPVFDYRAEMHKTRLNVDEMLAAGEIEEAETYMEIRRQFFWENGYRIRKLNQAYFAFHGAYADIPGGAAGAADPVGPAVRALRDQNDSLVDFINQIAWMWSFEQLQAAIKEPESTSS
ncbi:hypothetical protein ACFLXI_00590 [Chloroflexota bacterium]